MKQSEMVMKTIRNVHAKHDRESELMQKICNTLMHVFDAYYLTLVRIRFKHDRKKCVAFRSINSITQFPIAMHRFLVRFLFFPRKIESYLISFQYSYFSLETNFRRVNFVVFLILLIIISLFIYQFYKVETSMNIVFCYLLKHQLKRRRGEKQCQLMYIGIWKIILP